MLLLFSSEWCPHCKPFCGKLKKFLSSIRAQAQSTGGGGEVEVVWVSSDNSSEEAQAYFNSQHEWLMVPFDSPLRNNLKKRYGFCAMREMKELGMNIRQAGIPTLALVASNGELIATLETSKALAMQTLTRMRDEAAAVKDE